MIRFLHPEALLLALVPVLLLRRTFFARPWPAVVLRATCSLLLAAALAGPYARGAEEGRDLIVVVDRSRSVPVAAASTITEVLDRAAKEAGPKDRVGVLVYGRAPAVESPPVEGWRRGELMRIVDADASNLAAALDAAGALVPAERPGSLLVLSDGEDTGGDSVASARRAARRGLRVDAIPLRRPVGGDTAVEDLEPPPEAALGEPIQFSAWVRSDRAVEAQVRLRRDGVEVALGRRTLREGLDRLTFRDRILEPGVHTYELSIEGLNDRVPENDKARAVVRVTGPLRVVCVTPGGRSDRLTKSLASAGISVAVLPPERAPSTLDELEGVRAVVLEDVPAGVLPTPTLKLLERFVMDLGGGLLMTGGRASFGPGGYHESPVGRVLPVSLEMREERRKFALAMAIVLDRSGSMSLPAGKGTKMDLANRGAVAAVHLLSRIDQLAVIAVDSSPHLVVPMGPVTDAGAITKKILKIESMGGGIFTSTGIHAAAGQLEKAGPAVRHIVLFADAADAEEPGDLATFVPQLRAAGVTISVIGLGSPTDSDAEFLRSVASDGGGRATFTADPADLPRVFAEETIQVAKSAIVEEATALKARADLALLGSLEGLSPPPIGGYDVAYAKPTARVGIETADAERAPIVAWHGIGLGRTASVLAIADGPLSGDWSTWDRYADLFSTLTRWTCGVDASGDLFVEVSRRGHEGRLSIEAETGREVALSGAHATLIDPKGESRELPLRRTGDARAEATFDLEAEGTHRVVVATAKGEVIRTAPLVIPYSPEFEPRLDPKDGERRLASVAVAGEGRVDPPSGTLFDGPREGRSVRSLLPILLLAALVAFVLEILVRRTGWSPAWARGSRTPPAPQGSPSPATATRRSTGSPSTKPEPPGAAPQAEPSKAPTEPGGIAAAVERARARRKR